MKRQNLNPDTPCNHPLIYHMSILLQAVDSSELEAAIKEAESVSAESKTARQHADELSRKSNQAWEKVGAYLVFGRKRRLVLASQASPQEASLPADQISGGVVPCRTRGAAVGSPWLAPARLLLAGGGRDCGHCCRQWPGPTTTRVCPAG